MAWPVVAGSNLDLSLDAWREKPEAAWLKTGNERQQQHGRVQMPEIKRLRPGFRYVDYPIDQCAPFHNRAPKSWAFWRAGMFEIEGKS